ncbi:hypothetical protein ABPG74_000607 [Tetrahymena malaccensis]
MELKQYEIIEAETQYILNYELIINFYKLNSNSYVKKSGKIIDTENMIIIKTQQENNYFLGQTYMNDIQLHIFQQVNEVYWHKNILNIPFYTLNFTTSQTFQDLYFEKGQNLIALYDSSCQCVLIYDIIKNIKQVSQVLFNAQFDLNIKLIDWNNSSFIYVIGSSFYLYNPKKNEKYEQIGLLDSKIIKYEYCYQQQVIVAQTQQQNLYIIREHVQSKIETNFNYLNQQIVLQLKFILKCSENILIIYSPVTQIINLLTEGDELPFQDFNMSKISNYAQNIPIVNLKEKLLINQFNIDTIYFQRNDFNNYINFFDYRQNNTNIFYDLNNNILIGMTGVIKKISIMIIPEIQCIGQLQTKQFINGGFDLDVQVFYKPISNMVLKIVSNSFPSIKDSKGNIIINSGQIELILNLNLEQCSVGQIFKTYGNSIICESCPDSKYSLSLNDKECKECPDSAVSCIGSNIQLKNGYWRENENTDNILYCNLNPLPCQPQLSTSKFNCNEGYKGPLCQCCDVYGDIWGESYAQMFNPGYCNKCSQNKTKIIAYNLFIFILISSYVLFILKRIIMQLEAKIMGYYLNKLDMIYFGSTLNQSDRSQIISKILTDHLQILSFVCTFTVNMPVSLTLPIQISGNTFNMTSKSIDCIFSNYPNLQPLWLYQSLWSFSLPLGISFLYLLIGIIFNFFKINIFIKYLRTAALFIYFYFFPMVINLASRSINCISIGNKKYLDLDLTVNCFDVNKHKPYILFYSLPVIIIWGILIPIYLFYKIHSTKQKNKSIFITIKYSFFFAGYKDKYYYWEFWKLFYKANLIFISELLKQNIYIKVGIMNLALLFQFYLLVKSKPFVREYFNNLQQKSIVLCAFSLNLCFILIVGDQNGLAYQMALILLVTFANLFYIFILLIGLSRLLIPTQKQDRNIIQNIIFQIKKKYPQLLDVQLQNKQKIKSLLKLNKVKCKIKQLMKYLKVYDFYSSQSLQSFFNIKKNQDVSISPQAQQFNQNLSSEISDEKHLLFKNSNSIKKLRNKWSYYTRNTKSNQISLRTSNLNFFPNNYEKDDQVMETQNSIQIVKNSSNIKFQIQLSDHQN